MCQAFHFGDGPSEKERRLHSPPAPALTLVSTVTVSLVSSTI